MDATRRTLKRLWLRIGERQPDGPRAGTRAGRVAAGCLSSGESTRKLLKRAHEILLPEPRLFWVEGPCALTRSDFVAARAAFETAARPVQEREFHAVADSHLAQSLEPVDSKESFHAARSALRDFPHFEQEVAFTSISFVL